MKRKILSTILAGALMISAGTGVFAAEAGNADLFTEGFESTTAATGGEVATDVFRNGAASYVITENGTDVKLEIPVGDVAEAWVGKMVVAEAWYHIDGELDGYDETEVPGEEEGTTTTVVTGEQVTMKYYKDAETVESFKGLVGTVYAMDNAVYPNTDTTGWHRIRIAGMPQEEATEAGYSDNKLVIGLLGTRENVKLYVDDVRVFVTDNIADIVSKGNSDFDTYTEAGINGWMLWDTDPSQPQFLKGYVEYSKNHTTTGEYSIKLTRNNKAGAFGLQKENVCLPDFGISEGMYVLTGVDSRGEYNNGENWDALKIRAAHLAVTNNTEYGWYAEKQAKTSYSINQVGAKTNGTLTIGRGNVPNMALSESFVYLDSVVLRNAGDGFAGLKVNTETAGGNKTDHCTTVKTLSHGDVVYPYAMFSAAPTGAVNVIVARYVKNQNGVLKLDDISTNSFEGYTDISFDGVDSPNVKTASITIPSSGEYTYKIMTWGALGGMNTLLDTVEYEVK